MKIVNVRLEDEMITQIDALAAKNPFRNRTYVIRFLLEFVLLHADYGTITKMLQPWEFKKDNPKIHLRIVIDD